LPERPSLSQSDLIDALPDAVFGTDAGGRIVLVNRQAEQLFGWSREDLLGRTLETLVPERTGAGLDLRGRRADGTEFPVEVSLSPMQTDEGIFTIAAVRDLTERRRAEEAGRRARRQALVAQLGQRALSGRDLDGLLDDAVRIVAQALNVQLTKVLELVPGRDEFVLRAAVGFPSGAIGRTVVQQGQQLLRDHGVVSGVTVPIALEAETLGVLGAHTTHSRTFSEDDASFLQSVANILAAAMGRRRTESALEESRGRLQAVLDNTPAAVYLKDLGGRYLLGNAEFYRVMGTSAETTLGHTDAELLPAAQAAAVRANDAAVLNSCRPLQFNETVLVGTDERIFQSLKFPVVDDSGAPYGLGGVSLDVTSRVRAEKEREQLEERLRRSERLESVGQLAGGIAHDFNNLLAVVANYAGFLAAEVPPGSQLAEDVQQIIQATQQASELTRRLLQFSRRQPGHPEVLDVTEVITEIERLLMRTLGENIMLRTSWDGRVWRVLADRGQLEQVLMNLALNARDAMPDGGELRMRAENVELDEPPAHGATEGPRAGRFVRLTVSDSGSGMSKEVAERAFEPFFTTKPSGHGTGLGLASVYGIVAQAGGWLDLDTGPARGTAVTAWLPASDAPAASRAAADDENLPGHGELVLVVEDQPSVREITRRILSSSGYEVIEAEGGTDALQALDQRRLEPMLLVTDVVMPGLSGPELVARLRERIPGLPVVFVSGLMEHAAATSSGGAGPTLFVEKPFSAGRLLQAVGEALQSAD
jgi:two-component system, cell cycle sensor histidine kinase and response regulator CckA